MQITPILDYAWYLGLTPISVGQVEYTFKEHDRLRVDSQSNLFYRHATR